MLLKTLGSVGCITLAVRRTYFGCCGKKADWHGRPIRASKGSTGFPDRYRERLFFQSDRFLGAAWKAMPADLSQPRLGSRALDLLDDMSNWGTPKFVLGEVDVFQIEPDHELYGHMNVNYLRLESLPRFEDGWRPVLDALRGGAVFRHNGRSVNFRVHGERATVR